MHFCCYCIFHYLQPLSLICILLLLRISLFATPGSYNYIKALPDNRTATAAWQRSKHSQSYTAEEQYSNSHTTTAWWKPHNREHHTAKATQHRTSHSKPTWLKPLNRICKKTRIIDDSKTCAAEITTHWKQHNRRTAKTAHQRTPHSKSDARETTT